MWPGQSPLSCPQEFVTFQLQKTASQRHGVPVSVSITARKSRMRQGEEGFYGTEAAVFTPHGPHT